MQIDLERRATERRPQITTASELREGDVFTQLDYWCGTISRVTEIFNDGMLLCEFGSGADYYPGDRPEDYFLECRTVIGAAPVELLSFERPPLTLADLASYLAEYDIAVTEIDTGGHCPALEVVGTSGYLLLTPSELSHDHFDVGHYHGFACEPFDFSAACTMIAVRRIVQEWALS